jgi:hypothetical protein
VVAVSLPSNQSFFNRIILFGTVPIFIPNSILGMSILYCTFILASVVVNISEILDAN